MQAFFAYLAKITEITKMNIGLVVKQLRKQKKFTQSEVADCIDGYDAGNLSRFESGTQNIAQDKLAAIAAKLGTTVSDIYRYAEI
jgi:transcriptional regulator with XRE-family HTH domain